MLEDSPLVERDREIELLRKRFERSLLGDGGLLVVEGRRGVGKSRLLREAAQSARNMGLRVFSSRSGELEQSHALGGLIDLFAPLAVDAEHEKLDLFRGRAALIAELLDDSKTGDDKTGSRGQDLPQSFYWFVVNLASHQPVALLIDDVQWSDPLSLRLLIYLAQRIHDLPVALIVAVHTGEVGAQSDLVTRLVAETMQPTLTLDELSVDGTRDVLNSVLGTVDDQELTEAFWWTSRGNPFLLRELLAEIDAHPAIWGQEDRVSWVKSHAPQSLIRNTMLRLQNLGDDAMRLARALAVLGERPSLSVAASMLTLEARQVMRVEGRLIAANILKANSNGQFLQPMIRAIIYAGIPPHEKADLHTAAASRLHTYGSPAEVIAGHLILGTPISGRWVTVALRDAARAAARKGSPEIATRYLRHALEYAEGDAEASVVIDLGVYEAAAGEPTAVGRFEAALRLLDEEKERNRAIYALGETLYAHGRHEEAAAVFRDGVNMAADIESARRFEGAFMCAAQFVVTLRKELRERLADQDRLWTGVPTTATDHVILANLAIDSALSVREKSANEVADAASRAVVDRRLLASEATGGMATNHATLALLWSGAHNAALEQVNMTIEEARESGSIPALAEASMVRSMIVYARGDLSDAILDAQASIRGMEGGWRSAVPTPQSVLVAALIEKNGGRSEALANMRAVERMPASSATRGMDAYYFVARGQLRYGDADVLGAFNDFLIAGRRFNEYLDPVSPAIIPWRPLAAIAAADLGRHNLARELIDEEENLSRTMRLPLQIGRALRVRAEIGAHSDPVACLTEAVAVLEDADARLELAKARLALGTAQIDANAKEEARESLRQALDDAYQCGADLLMDATREALIRSGARPRRPALTGVESLTPTESAIAAKVADGQTSRVIAEDLFLSENTIAWHLRRIFLKLGVASRAEVAARLRESRD